MPKVSVHTPVERAYCPLCGEDVGPAQEGEKQLWCRNHGWVAPISKEVFEDEEISGRPPD